ncbi:MAG: DNA primase [Candidatus Omnitrophica bacterium]|nr:DNA primase [Candidatus Omnitrophota bacterium]
MAGIPEYIIDQVRERTDIAEVISKYIPLKKAGRNYRALCPFHHEKTPSFMVSPAKQIYHCFGCGAGGNVFNFLIKYERVEFPEAVRELAKNAGVTIPETSSAGAQKSSLTEKLHVLNKLVADFYCENLRKGQAQAVSKNYLVKRNINQNLIERFMLGYAPKSWNGLLDFLKKKGYDESVLQKSGLIIEGRNGKFFDRFRDKIMFPISDVKGRIKGFGSRALDNSMPKYMNSPDTFIYNKGNHLYGLNLSWEEIRDKNSVVVVEGYTDLLTPFQHGIKNIAASLGTALTLEQIRLLKRYTNNIVILFDSDQAGENATLRSLDLLVEEDVKVKVVQLPKGEDPDSFINKNGPDKFKELLNSAQDLFDYKLNLLLSRHNAADLEGKALVANEMLPLISKIKNAILQSGYLKRLAEILIIGEADLRRELAKVKPDYSYHYKPYGEPQAEPLKANMAEKILAGLMLEDRNFVRSVKENLNCGDFKDISIKRIVERLFEYYDMNVTIGVSKLIDCFKDEENVRASISELIATCENLVDKKKNLDDCIQWVKQCGLKDKLKNLCKEIKTAQNSGDESRVVDLVIKYNDMMKEVRT